MSLNHVKLVIVQPVQIVQPVFKWDGSNLGVYDKSVVKCVWEKDINKGRTDEYWLISIKNESVYCIVKKVKDSFPCIVDELKCVFGLNKLGTHLIKIKGISTPKFFLLIRVDLIDNNFPQEVSLKDYISKYPFMMRDEFFRNQVRKIFVFRDLLGLSSTFESSIRVKTPFKGIVYPVSFRDTSHSITKGGSVFSKTTLDKWFVNPDSPALDKYDTNTISSILGDSLSWNGDMVGTLLKCRTKIQDIINRVDEGFIWISVYIIDRISKRLSELK